MSGLLCLIKMKFSMWIRDMPLVDSHLIFLNQKGDDVIVPSFKFSPNSCQYLNFDWTYKLYTWYWSTTALNNLITKSAGDLDRCGKSQVKIEIHKNEQMVIPRKGLDPESS